MGVQHRERDRPVGHRRGAGTARASQGRVAGLDGLRGLAVAAVVAFHAFPAAVPGGFIGVDVFFVLSGFLITRGLLHEQRSGPVRIGRFYWRRARRIVPALLLLLVVWSGVSALLGGPLTDGLPAQVLGALTFSGNWTAIAADQSYFLASSPDLFKHLWSLAIEEQFYLLFPLLLLVLLRRRPVVQLTALLALALLSASLMALLFAPHDPSRGYYGTDTHSFGLLLGAAAALISSRLSPSRARAVRALRLIAAPSALICLGWAALHLSGTAAVTYRGGLLGVAAVTALLLVSLSTGGRHSEGVLDIAPLVALGRRSYGIYLWHWPLLVVADLLVPASSRTSAAGVTVAAAAIATTLVCAWISYRFVEQPALAPAARGGRRPLRATRRAAAVALVAAALAGIVTATSIAADRPTPAQAAETQIIRGEEAIRHHRPLPRPHRHGSPALAPAVSAGTGAGAAPHPTEPAGPTPAVPALPMRITAIGDSVMLAAAPAVLHRFPEATIDAAVSRQPWTAPALLRDLSAQGRLDDVVVVGLGTNGALGRHTLADIRTAIGDRRLVLVDVWADRSWTGGVNRDLDAFAATHPRTVVAHWHAAIGSHQELLGPDGIHPGAAGGRLYARVLSAAVRAVQRRP